MHEKKQKKIIKLATKDNEYHPATQIKHWESEKWGFNLILHGKLFVGKSRRQYQCHDCDKVCTTRPTITWKQNNAKKKKWWGRCGQCGKSFK